MATTHPDCADCKQYDTKIYRLTTTLTAQDGQEIPAGCLLRWNRHRKTYEVFNTGSKRTAFRISQEYINEWLGELFEEVES